MYEYYFIILWRSEVVAHLATVRLRIEWEQRLFLLQYRRVIVQYWIHEQRRVTLDCALQHRSGVQAAAATWMPLVFQSCSAVDTGRVFAAPYLNAVRATHASQCVGAALATRVRIVVTVKSC